MSNLGRRVVTALVLAPLFLAALFLLPPLPFAMFLGLILLLAAWEWAGLCALPMAARICALLFCSLLAVVALLFDLLWPLAVLGAGFWVVAAAAVILFPRGRMFWSRREVRLTAGLLVLMPAWAGLSMLQAGPLGPWLVLWTMLMVWATDIGGYFAGRRFGRRKLAPDVSPGKTVEGLLGGVLAALLVSLAMVFAGSLGAALGLAVIVTLLVVAAAVFGDLFESLAKRVAGAKDSGSLLPGHGGVLDRIDAALAAAPISAVLLVHFGPRLGL